MRKRWIQVNGELIDAEHFTNQGGEKAPFFMPDIRPYVSPITGEVISSRPQHEVHLRAHEVYEIGPGDRMPHELKRRQTSDVKADLIRAFHEHR